MGCEYCSKLRTEDFVSLGEDFEDGIGEWSMERLSDGVTNLAYSEGDEVVASIEITHCPFCGAVLS